MTAIHTISIRSNTLARALWFVAVALSVVAVGSIGSFLGVAAWVIYALVSGPG